MRLCITNCITKYHKVLLQYSSVLQSVSPYYKVLLQYDCVTQYVTLNIDPPYIWNRSEFRMPKRAFWARASTETCVKRTQLFCTTFQKIVHLYHPLLRVCSHIFPIIPLLDSGKLFEFASPMHCWTLTMIHHLQCASSGNHPPTSPNISFTTRYGFHHWSVSRMKRHLQYTEQHDSPSKLTKYRARHERSFAWLSFMT